MGYYQRWCSELNDILRFMGRRGRIIRGPKPRVVFSCHVSGTGYIRECTVVYSTRCVRDNETTVMMWTQLFLYATAKSVRFCARPFIFLLLSNKKKKKTKVVPHDGHTPDFFHTTNVLMRFASSPKATAMRPSTVKAIPHAEKTSMDTSLSWILRANSPCLLYNSTSGLARWSSARSMTSILATRMCSVGRCNAIQGKG